MNKIGKRKLLILTLGVLALILGSILLADNKIAGRQIKAGFVMQGSMETAGWDKMQYDGVKRAADKLGMKLFVEENVSEFSGECENAIRRLAKEGAELIVLASYGYSQEAQEVIKEFPNIVFYTSSSEYHAENLSSYFARMYQARYLSGIVAGMKTRFGKIGYVAAMPNVEVNRGINAFALGVRRVNPEAEIGVIWTGEWNNTEKETEAAKCLIQEGADVLTYHQNLPNVVRIADEAGVYSIGYHEAVDGCSEKYLTSVVCNWELIYEELFRGFLIGKGKVKENYWIGLEAGAVELSEYSNEVTPEIRAEVERAKEEILSGRDVFSGEIYDSRGILHCGEMEMISDEVLWGEMDWYAEGVRFYGE